jgi:DNA gyrase subunit B
VAKYIDDKIETIKDDITKLRTKPHMYISHTGPKGALHLASEAYMNAIDEGAKLATPCDTITVEYEEANNRVTVTDNGRGIPFDKVEEICTYLQSGSNLHKDTKDKTKQEWVAGDHGVGLTAINALSRDLVFIIYRDGQKGIMRFDDGKLADTTITSADPEKHGTTISFIPDEKWLKKCNINVEELRNRLDTISYLIPPKIKKFNFKLVKKGKGIATTEKLHHKNGISDMLDTMVKDQAMKTIRLGGLFEEGDSIARLDLAITYDGDDISDFTNQRSYCNYVNTIDGGEHVKAFKFAWAITVTKLVTDAMTENERKKYPITFEDCRQGLCAVISLLCKNPYFTGQTKQQVGNDALYKPIVKLVQNELKKYFKNNSSELKKLVSIVKSNAKARLEVRKIKKSDFKKLDSFEAAAVPGFWPCILMDDPNSEIFVCEGDSSGTQVTGVRDDRYQAVYKLRGNPKNVYGLTLPKIMENAEVRNFYQIGGAGIRETFNPRKFRFGNVIMFFDSDIDGWNMQSLFSAMLLWCSPQLVEEGRVYRTLAPLYLINDKKHPYLTSKSEYYALYADRIVEHVTFIDAETNRMLSKEEAIELIKKNSAYINEIEALQKYFYVDSELFEFILKNRHERNLAKLFEKKFPEMRYQTADETGGSFEYISGVFKGSHYSMYINENFFKKCNRMIRFIDETNNSHIYYKVIDNGVEDPEVHSLGTIFRATKKYLPPVIERIKGVGELPGEIIWETTLNPSTRKLLRLTCEDLEMELEKVRVLHGPDPSLRKKFMQDYIFNREDLDT